MKSTPTTINTTSTLSKRPYDYIKRGIDILLSSLAILLLSPIYIIVAIWIVMDDGLPILFRQKRAGYLNKPFSIYKFRTMKIQQSNPATYYWEGGVPDDFVFKQATDNSHQANFTGIGAFLRKWSLDELPQFFNVLLGNMSLVGPRPELTEIANCYNQEQFKRLRVKPGVTGWAQVNGRSNINHGEKIKLDLDYVEHYGLWMDIKILFLTVLKVLFKQGAV
ncbi:Putative colanic biosynthesis UDP-glucose lipid carrier transferase [Legionella beliardensis]|uniref:Colanic biosynthesis UDP-glucose lipid carrier transferase n=1 Tax=Legionella beliardensis TaxID=91822 RepID=A0A378HZK0_9GAMM|nr:sugar transferase [Legionella beliardensis]STX27716.1 Putative colanic biosynthesis UDP-glucose lipid carrier transferase [Legionella beliardensis]